MKFMFKNIYINKMVRYNSKATKNLKGIFEASEIATHHNIGPYGNAPKNRERFLSVVRKQINNGANPNLRFLSNNITPLMWAVKNNHLSLVKLLLRNGAKPLLKDSKGRSLFDSHYRPKGMSKKCRDQAKNIIKNLSVVPMQRRYRKKYRVKTARESLLKKSKLPDHVIDRITDKYLFDVPPPPPPRLRRSGARSSRKFDKDEPRGLLPIGIGGAQYKPKPLLPKKKPIWKSKPIRPSCDKMRCDYNYLVYADADTAYRLEFEASLAEGMSEEEAREAADKIWDETLKKGNKFRPGISVNKFCIDNGCDRCGPPKSKGVRYCTKKTHKMGGFKPLFKRKKGLDKERDWQRQHGREDRGSMYPPFLPFGAGVRGKKKKIHKKTYKMGGFKPLFKRKKGLDKERDWQRQHGREDRGSLYPPFLPFGAGVRGKKKKIHKR
jgi:hypothetical protein